MGELIGTLNPEVGEKYTREAKAAAQAKADKEVLRVLEEQKSEAKNSEAKSQSWTWEQKFKICRDVASVCDEYKVDAAGKDHTELLPFLLV